ncbi:MAG: ferrochelatase [Deltaproteobacteria bacterium]
MIGVVLLNMGGPDSLSAVRPFLQNLFSDREIIRLGPAFLQPVIAWIISFRRAPKSRAAYEKIGGKSPLADITAAQAHALEKALSQSLGEKTCRCLSGMRYWRPRTPDALAELSRLGVRRVIALSLYPHYSRATNGSSIDDFERAARALGMEYRVIDSYPDDPLYVDALTETVSEGLARLLGRPWDEHGGLSEDAVLVYSAHSLPKKMVEEGDPYVQHLERTIAALEACTGVQGVLSFQSRSGPVKWLEPATDRLLHDLLASGKRKFLVLPVSFVSDHIETLYEIDMLFGDMVRAKGGTLVRTPALNTRPRFIEALARLVLKGLTEAKWLG